MEPSREWAEEEWIPLSALQHYSYCPRQCALIHQEQTFDENLYTLRGQAVHRHVDTPESAMEDGIRVERALPLFCKRLGLTGKADMVEFLLDGAPYPVEYKHGPRREHEHDDLQLAGQAICLEEMTGKEIPEGAIYHHGSRRRREVKITAALRQQVESITLAVRAMLASATLPPPLNDKRCQHCSLKDACQPEVVAEKERQSTLRVALFRSEES